MAEDYIAGVYCRECEQRSTFVQVGHAMKCNTCGWIPTGPEALYND